MQAAIEKLYKNAIPTFIPSNEQNEHLIAVDTNSNKVVSSSDADINGDQEARHMKVSIPEHSFIIHSHPVSGLPTPSPQDYQTASQIDRPNFVLSQHAIYVAMPGTNPNTKTHIKVADVKPTKGGHLQITWNQ